MRQDFLESRFLVNLQMIVDDLEDDYDITYFYKGTDEQRLASPEIYYGQKKVKKNVLYVGQTSVFEEYPIKDSEISCVYVGDVPEDLENSKRPAIVIGGRVCWQEIFNRVQGEFVRILEWNRRLLRVLEGGGGLYELCVAAIEFFKNPLYVHDENFNILAMPMWVVGMSAAYMDETTGNLSVPLRTLKKFKVDVEYIKTLTYKKAALWNPHGNTHRVMYMNIWAEEQRYCGRVLIQELNRSFKPSDFIYAEHLGAILAIAFERNMYKTDSVTSFEQVLNDIYLGKVQDEQYIASRLKMVRWNCNDRYLCLVIEADEDSFNIFSVNKICSTMSIVLKKSFSFSVDKRVYTICNLSQSEMTEEACRAEIEKLNQVTDVLAGASIIFDNFYKIKEYYRMADKALEMGRKDGGCYFPFSDYVLDYILHHFNTEFEEDIICSQAVQNLIQMDKEKGTEFFTTLKLYLENGMQQTQTANQLFIHRSTLMYRLEKIQELTGINLDDPSERLYTQISIHMLGNVE